jgi:hypothetical protein
MARIADGTGRMNKKLAATAGLCILIAVLSQVASYLYFNSVIEYYKDSLRENEKLKEKIREYMEPNEPYMMEPYLVTRLGWYLHDSSDPVPESRGKLTIYGQVRNIGAVNASNCMLIVSFYSGNRVVQTSEIDLGTVRYWGGEYLRRNINCELADSVTRIEVSRTWSY